MWTPSGSVERLKMKRSTNSRQKTETTLHYLDLPLRLERWWGSVWEEEALRPSCSQVRHSQQGGGSLSSKSTHCAWYTTPHPSHCTSAPVTSRKLQKIIQLLKLPYEICASRTLTFYMFQELWFQKVDKTTSLVTPWLVNWCFIMIAIITDDLPCCKNKMIS